MGWTHFTADCGAAAHTWIHPLLAEGILVIIGAPVTEAVGLHHAAIGMEIVFPPAGVGDDGMCGDERGQQEERKGDGRGRCCQTGEHHGRGTTEVRPGQATSLRMGREVVVRASKERLKQLAATAKMQE